MIGFSFFLFSFYTQTEKDSVLILDKMKNNIRFGIEMYISGGAKEADKFIVYKNDTIKVSAKRWGVYQIARVETKKKYFSLSRTFILGSDPKEENYAIYLSDNNLPLSVSGKNSINGKAILPKAGVKSTNIEGYYFESTHKVNGPIEVSKAGLRAETKSFVEEVEKWHINLGDNIDSIMVYKDGMILDNNSFKTIAVNVKSEIVENCKLSGNIILITDKKTRFRNCDFKNIIVSAPAVEIEKNNLIQAQFFCTDSAILKESSKLLYPSTIVLLNNKSESGFIRIEEKSQFMGVLMSSTKESIDKNIAIYIEKSSKLYGEVICNNAVSFESTIYGSLTAKSLLLITNSAIYENQLLNTVIDYTKLPPKWVYGFRSKSLNNSQIIDYF